MTLLLYWIGMFYLDMPMCGLHSNRTPMVSNYPAHWLKNISQTSIWTFSFTKNKHLGRALRLSFDGEDSVVKEGDNGMYYLEGASYDEMEYRKYVEVQRRRKIGLANKGKAPWNKGKKHSKETRELIRQKTIEALRNPKIKRKMSGYPRFHSAVSKAKIGFALRRLWKERLKRKMLKDKCYLEWAGSISEAAKVGFQGEQELEWDSYEKMKADIALQHILWKTEKAKAREYAELKTKRTAEARAVRMARIADKRKEKEKWLQAKEPKKAIKKLVNQKELFGFSCLKSKNQMMKVDSAVSSSVPLTEAATHVQSATEKWDLEFIEKEKLRRRVSFADQLRAAKNRQMKQEDS